jgi:hypothetical protein
MEKDIWKLMYWVRHTGQVGCRPPHWYHRGADLPEKSYKWRQPDSARFLINRAVFQANILLGHLRLAGNIPARFREVDFKCKGKGFPKLAFTQLTALLVPNGDASILYAEDDDNSMYGALTLNAMTEDEDRDKITELEFS